MLLLKYMALDKVLNSENVSSPSCVQFTSWSDNTGKFSHYGTLIDCKRSIEKKFSISDNTEEVSLSLKNASRVEASTQMNNNSEPHKQASIIKRNYD